MKHLACLLPVLCALLPHVALAQMPGRVDQLGDTATFQSSDRVLCYTGGRLQLCTPRLVQDASPVGGRTLAARALDIVNAADDGMKCDGATNDTAALNAAIARSRLGTVFAEKANYGMHIQLPMGRCVVSGVALTLSGSQSLSLRGYGPEQTELVIANDADGLTITLDGAGAWLRGSGSTAGSAVTISDLALVRTTASEGKTGIIVTSTATVNPGARQVTLRNVTWRGQPGASAWLNGYRFVNTTGTLVEDAYWHAAQTNLAGDSFGVGTGVFGAYTTTGSFISTEHRVSRSNVQGTGTCYSLSGLIQGVTMDHSSCVGAVTGILGTSTDGTNDSLLVTSSHIDATSAAIQTTGWNNVSVTNSYFLANNAASSNTWTALAITQGARNMFTGNHVFGRSSATAQSMVAITNTTGLDSQVSVSAVGNSAEFLAGPMVVLAGSTANAQVVGNLCLSCGGLGSDARGLSTWSGNTLNGKLISSGLDGALVIGTGVQARITANAGGTVAVDAANTVFNGAVYGLERGHFSTDGSTALYVESGQLKFRRNGVVVWTSP